jgi:protease YdgD
MLTYRKRMSLNMSAQTLSKILLGICFIFIALYAYAAKEKIHGIVGTDDRIVMHQNNWPWSSIGKVIRNDDGYCTGTLIHERYVLTVAHCLYNANTGTPLSPKNLTFYAGVHGTENDGESRIDSIFFSPEYVYNRADETSMFANDWAILKLSSSLPLLPITLSDEPSQSLLNIPSHARVIRAGYSFDRADYLMADSTCHLYGQRDKGRLLIHDCDSTEGDSGSPFFIAHDDKTIEVIGMHVAISKNQKTQHGLAIPASRIKAAIPF